MEAARRKASALQGFPTGGEMSDSSLNRRGVDGPDKPGPDVEG
jgi:hypothetical protein